MLLELAIGDAYGAGFEYVSDSMVRSHNDLSRYVQHPRHTLTPGSYTDDTQMSIAIAEAMLSGQPWTGELLADRFVLAFRRDPRQGYSTRTNAALVGAAAGSDFVTRLDPVSDTSGAAMRAAPLGLLSSIDAVLVRCRLQAALTHNTPSGIHAAVAASLMTHYCQYRLGPKRELPAFIARHVPGDWARTWRGKVGRRGDTSVAAALTALVRCSCMTELLRMCVDYTGDVDTVAAVALAAASCCDEIEQDLPAHLHTGFERGPYGYDFLRDLDRRLMSSCK